jgi:hypothetical protein
MVCSLVVYIFTISINIPPAIFEDVSCNAQIDTVGIRWQPYSIVIKIIYYHSERNTRREAHLITRVS